MQETEGVNEREAHGLAGAAKQLAERASTLIRLELELAGLELKRKAGLLGTGIGLAVGAAVLVFYGVGFGLAAIAAGIATATSVWLALLIVFIGLLLVAGAARLLRPARDQEGDAAGAGAGDPGGKADDGGAEAQWPRITAARPSRYASTSRRNARGLRPRSRMCAPAWT